MLGYGNTPPKPSWPHDARIALQFVVNYEEGAELSVLHGDETAEMILADFSNSDTPLPSRDLEVESVYEFGSRVGAWRLQRLFAEYNVPITFFAVAMALERNPVFARAMIDQGHELACHGYRWIDYQTVNEKTERQHIRRAIEIHQKIAGERPLGWYTGRVSPNTRRLVVQAGGFMYDSDSTADELPYWDLTFGKPHLIIPYTLDCNDMRFNTSPGLVTSDDFYRYLRDTFEFLYDEGKETPRMMTVGVHCRLSGRPGRAAALQKFLNFVRRFEKVWICRRIDIARHWHANHPAASPHG